jgi:excisionase family DNA binding protein
MIAEAPTPLLPEALPPREAAELLRIHVRTLQRKAAAGQLPAPYRSGRVVRYSRQALLEYLRTGGGASA